MGDKKGEGDALNESLAKYLIEHSDRRVWQNIRAWSCAKFVLIADDIDINDETKFINVRDTFYFKGRNS